MTTMSATGLDGFGTGARNLVDRPSETLRIGADTLVLPDRIRCKVLVVEASVKLDAIIQAEEVFVHGEVTGLVRAVRVTVAGPGKLIGECHATTMNLAGRANGLIQAHNIVARSGSRLEGEVIADRLSRQDGAILFAQAAVGPGFSQREDLVRRARERLLGSNKPLQIAKAPVVAPAPTEATISSRRLADRIDQPAATLPNLVPAAAEPQQPFLIN